jgi:hypothetical protein
LAYVTCWPGGPSVSAALRPAVPALIEETIAAIGSEVPEYDRPLRGTFGENVRRGTTSSIERFLALVASEERDARAHSEIYVELGRSEFRAGRSLESLLAAYRVGARVMWRGFAAEGQALGIEPHLLYRLAEALFAYVDELSAESVEGYAEEQTLLAGRRERERDGVLELLVRSPAPSVMDVRAQAARAGWPLPERLTPVAMPATTTPASQLQHRLPPDSLAASLEGMTVVLAADLNGPGRMAELRGALAGVPAACGPTVPLAEVGEAVQRAILAARLQQVGVLSREGFVMSDEHLVELIVHRDPKRAQALIERALAPLQKLSPGPRRRLTETLEAWLEHAYNTTETAQALHVHPQTLRYRLRQLEETIGSERLSNADTRLELALALRAQRAQDVVRSVPAAPSAPSTDEGAFAASRIV